VFRAHAAGIFQDIKFGSRFLVLHGLYVTTVV
jgi:hypothetical protein